jgi:TonB-linked SusC/RagA family outer membrane protein
MRLLTKTLLIAMKTIFILLTAAMLSVHAAGLSQNISVSVKEVSLEKIFELVEQKTAYVFFYKKELLKDTKPVSIDVNNIPVEDFLKRVLKDQSLKYSITSNAVVITRDEVSKPKPAPEITLYPPAVPPLNGIVRGPDGRPLGGVSILLEGTTKGTTSAPDGSFTIDANPGDKLVFTFIGYAPKKHIVANTKRIIVSMELANSPLDEVQVVAYGTTTKRFATGNVTTIKGADIERQVVMNPMAALQGLVPGLNIQFLSGHSSSPMKVEIRGRNSLDPMSLTEPLYVIDGIPQTQMTLPGQSASSNGFEGVSTGVIQSGISYTGGQSPLFSINPRDIESITVLKDGDATAIYGSRAANGVILITTKRGKPGRTSVNVTMQQGLVMIPRYPKVLNLQEYLSMRREAFKNDVLTPTLANAPDLLVWDTTRSTDWVRQLAKNGRSTSANVSMSGGSNQTTFSLSGEFTKQMELNSSSGGTKRAGATLSVIHNAFNQKLRLTTQIAYTYTYVDAIQATDAAMTPPNAPGIWDKDGNLNYKEWELAQGISFPFGQLLRPNITKTRTLRGTLNADYRITRGLTVSARLGYNTVNNSNDLYTPIASRSPADKPTGEATLGTTEKESLTVESEIKYETRLGKGNLSAFIGASMQTTNSEMLRVAGSGYTNDDLLYSITHATKIVSADAWGEYKYAALYGRIAYNWDGKYIVNLNARRDGSSRFAPGKQYGNFGSVGLAWIASDENWMKKILPDWMSFAKLRGSFGVNGNDGSRDYEYLARYGKQGNGYLYDGTQTYAPVIPANQQYQWETVKNLEAALELGLFDNKMNLDFSWYQKRAANQLTNIPTPIYTGFDDVFANWVATVQNTGLELAIRAPVISKKDLSVNVFFNISRNFNRLIAYPNIERSPYATRYKIGSSLSTKYYFNLLGVDPMTGQYVYEDYDKDGFVRNDPSVFPGTQGDDRYKAYNMDPRFQGGFGASIFWKGFGLDFNFSYVSQLGMHPFFGVKPGGMKNLILPDEMKKNHWRKPGDDVKYARYSTFGSTNPVSPIDASYLRLNSVNLSYGLPDKLANKMGMQQCLLSVSAQNLFILTAYTSDPDVQGLGGVFNPVTRNIVAKLSLTF